MKFAEGLDGVRDVNKSDVVANTLTSVNKLVGYVSIAIIVILFGVSIFLISNTVTMGITVRKRRNRDHEIYRGKRFCCPVTFVIEGLIMGLFRLRSFHCCFCICCMRKQCCILWRSLVFYRISLIFFRCQMYIDICCRSDCPWYRYWIYRKFLHSAQAFESIGAYMGRKRSIISGVLVLTMSMTMALQVIRLPSRMHRKGEELEEQKARRKQRKMLLRHSSMRSSRT